MERRDDLALVICHNVHFLMEAQGTYKSANALASAINARVQKVAPNSINYLFKPHNRPKGKNGLASLPRLDVLSEAANALGCEVWELLHPDLKGLRKKLAGYDTMMQAARASEDIEPRPVPNEPPGKRPVKVKV